MLFQRLNDPAQSFNQSDSLRFSPQNPYDCFLFYKKLFTLELKSTESSSMTFYREDFIDKENKDKKYTFMIKKNQIIGLTKSSQFENVVSGFILNWRKTNHTYFLSIDKFNEMINRLDKKSFNEVDVIDASAYLIPQKLKKVKYHYNIEKFVNDMVEMNYVKGGVNGER